MSEQTDVPCLLCYITLVQILSKEEKEGELLTILQQAKAAWLAATLTFTTRGGKIKAKLEVVLEPAAPCPNGPTPSTATTPAPGGDRHRGPAAKARASLGDAYSATKSKSKLIEPITFDSSNNYINTNPMASILCTSCKIKVIDVGVCIDCRDITHVNCGEWDRTCRPYTRALIAEHELSYNCSHSSYTLVWSPFNQLCLVFSILCVCKRERLWSF